MGEVIYPPEWKTYSFQISTANPGPKGWKQYRRGKKLFWRNYKRDVPGGITFVERIGMLEAITRRAMDDSLTEQIFG